jgi:hypothetical protein
MTGSIASDSKENYCMVDECIVITTFVLIIFIKMNFFKWPWLHGNSGWLCNKEFSIMSSSWNSLILMEKY